MDTLDSLLATLPDGEPRNAAERWLFERRAERATPEDCIPVLLSWARAEELRFGDAARALALHKRILELDAENDEALA